MMKCWLIHLTVQAKREATHLRGLTATPMVSVIMNSIPVMMSHSGKEIFISKIYSLPLGVEDNNHILAKQGQ